MQAGRNYTFLLTAVDTMDAGSKATAAATVFVEPSPVTLQVVGGNRVVSNSSQLALQVCTGDSMDILSLHNAE